MVRYTLENEHGHKIRRPLNDKNTVINMPMQRFRDEAGCITWLKRQDHIRSGLIKFLRSEGVDPEKTNSTKDLTRDLTKKEQIEVKNGLKARFRTPSPEGGAKQGQKSADPLDCGISNKRRPYHEDDEYEDGLSETAGGLRPRKRAHGDQDKIARAFDGSALPSNSLEDRADRPPVNFVQKLKADSRVQNTRRTRLVRNVFGTVTRQAKRAPRAHSGLHSQSQNKTQAQGQHIFDVIDDSDTDGSSSSEFEAREQNKSNGEEEDEEEEEFDGQSTGNLVEKYFGGPLPHAQDLENHRKSVRQLLGEDLKEDEVGYNTLFANRQHSEVAEKTRAATKSRSGNAISRKKNNSSRITSRGIEKKVAKARHLQRSNGYVHPSAHTNDKASHLPRPVRMASPTAVRETTPIERTSTVDGAGSEVGGVGYQTIEGVHAHLDYRKVTPTTEYECQRLSEALLATREAYYEYTRCFAPTTNRFASYLSQWGEIRDSFERLDWSEEQDGEAPYLPQLMPWATSLADWPPHTKDSMYYQAWTRGIRTPVSPDGDFIDMPGEFLEQIGKLREEERQLKLDDSLRARGYAMVEPEEEEGEEEEL